MPCWSLLYQLSVHSVALLIFYVKFIHLVCICIFENTCDVYVMTELISNIYMYFQTLGQRSTLGYYVPFNSQGHFES